MVLSKLDWVLIAIMALSVLFSIIKGFTRELVSLAALIWGFLLACWFSGALATRILPWIRKPDVARLVAFLAILVGVIILGGLLSHMAGKLLDKAGLRWFDRLLGASFGLVRGLLVCMILVMVLAVFPVGPEPLPNSRLAPYVVQGTRVLVMAAPEELRARFRSGFDRLRRVWDERQGL
jgi:membrane protein required for colicin V production